MKGVSVDFNVNYILVVVVTVIIIALIHRFIGGQNQKKELDTKAELMINSLHSDLADLRRDVNDVANNLNKTLSDGLGRTQTSMQHQLSQSNKIVSDVSERLTRLDETNKRVHDVASELKTLQAVLQNPKQRGVFGEFYLNSLLENVLAPNQWQSQYRFKDGETVDAVIFLDKNRILPIDSKFSLENYNRALSAKTKEEKKIYMSRVKSDLKNRIDETSKYIRPDENTMDFAFMFIPSESLYYEAIINNVGQGGSSRDLIEYAFRDKKVIITSPTSFMAYLETVLQGLRSLQIEEQSKDIQKRVAMLGVHIAKYEEFIKKLGSSLGTTVNHYNAAYKEFGKVDKDIIKISGNSGHSVDPIQIDKPTN